MPSDTNPSANAPGAEQRKAVVDLAIVIAVFVLGSLSIPALDPILRRGHGVTGAVTLAAYQFTLEGLAPFLLILLRRESLRAYGLTRDGVGRSLALAVALAIVYDASMSWYSGAPAWIPLRRQPATRMSLEAGIPGALVGIAVTVAVWGAAEGFFGVYLASKVSRALRAPYRGWLSSGALAFALFNGAVHLIVGQGLEGFITSFASGYAIAVIPSVTGNAWGSLLVQTLTNSAGHR